MAMDGLPEGVASSGRVPEQLLEAAPILKWRRRRYRGEIAKEGLILGVSVMVGKYRQRGHRDGPQGSQEGGWRGLGWARTTCPPRCLVVALLPSFGDSGSFHCADFLPDFPGFFGALLMDG